MSERLISAEILGYDTWRYSSNKGLSKGLTLLPGSLPGKRGVKTHAATWHRLSQLPL